MILRGDRGEDFVTNIEAVRQEHRDIEVIELGSVDLVLCVSYLPLNGFIASTRSFLFPCDYQGTHGVDVFLRVITDRGISSDQNALSLRDVKIIIILVRCISVVSLSSVFRGLVASLRMFAGSCEPLRIRTTRRLIVPPGPATKPC